MHNNLKPGIPWTATGRVASCVLLEPRGATRGSRPVTPVFSKAISQGLQQANQFRPVPVAQDGALPIDFLRFL